MPYYLLMVTVAQCSSVLVNLMNYMIHVLYIIYKVKYIQLL